MKRFHVQLHVDDLNHIIGFHVHPLGNFPVFHEAVLAPGAAAACCEGAPRSKSCC